MSYFAILVTALISIFSLITPELNESRRRKLIRYIMLTLSIISAMVLAILTSQTDQESKIKDEKIITISQQLDSIKTFNENLELRTIDNAMLISGLSGDTIGSQIAYAEVKYNSKSKIIEMICKNLEAKPMQNISIDITDIDSLIDKENSLLIDDNSPEGQIILMLMINQQEFRLSSHAAATIPFMSGVPEKLTYPLNSIGNKKLLLRWNCKGGVFFQELITKEDKQSNNTKYVQASRIFKVKNDKKQILKIVDPSGIKPNWDKEFRYYILENYFYFNPVPGNPKLDKMVTSEMINLKISRLTKLMEDERKKDSINPSLYHPKRFN